MTGWCSTLAFGDRSPGSAEKPTRPATTHTPGELPAMGSNTVAEVVSLAVSVDAAAVNPLPITGSALRCAN